MPAIASESVRPQFTHNMPHLPLVGKVLLLHFCNNEILREALWSAAQKMKHMKFLLTSAGISNSSIHKALVDLLGKPVSAASALFVPTAIYALPNGGDIARRVICGSLGDPFCDMGWKSLGILELTSLPSIKQEIWVTRLQETDALLVGGGDCQYLTYWMKESGLADLLPSLLHRTVYVGLSAGSMIMTRFGTTRGGHTLPPESDKSLGLLDFAIHPHLDHESFPHNSFANLQKLAATIPVPSYAIDDQTAIKVTNGLVEVVSEGNWKLFTTDNMQ
jgi:dipeptidase E